MDSRVQKTFAAWNCRSKGSFSSQLRKIQWIPARASGAWALATRFSLWHTTAQPRSCVQARILRSYEVWLKVCTSHLRLAGTCHETASFGFCCALRWCQLFYLFIYMTRVYISTKKLLHLQIHALCFRVRSLPSARHPWLWRWLHSATKIS